MASLPFTNHNPQASGPQYLEDLATAYWYSEALFTAVEQNIFSILEPEGLSATDLASTLTFDPLTLGRFLNALCALGLLNTDGKLFYNSKLASDHLIKGKPFYLGDSILWRKRLQGGWQDLNGSLKSGGRVDIPAGDDPEDFAQRVRPYINAMDNTANAKINEILPCFEGLNLKGRLLDVGAGSGAISAGFLDHYPGLQATLVDLPEVLDYIQELLAEHSFTGRITYCPANILEPWPVSEHTFDLVILSNIVHAYSEAEIPTILAQAAKSLKPGGLLLIHDFFPEHYPHKAALFDLNMCIHTYNGRTFAAAWVRDRLSGLGLYSTELIPLATDTALIFAARAEQSLAELSLDNKTRVMARIKDLGFRQVLPIPTAKIHVADWTDLRCRFGCDRYGSGHCPPNSPSPAKTREVLADYSQALLLEGEPPGKSFQHLVLGAEKAAFSAGYHKAFAYWAGPCAMCDSCSSECRNPKDSRPSMEGAGIDVFTTARQAGLELRTLPQQGDYVKYFALLLLE